jgi:hypothetical protein
MSLMRSTKWKTAACRRRNHTDRADTPAVREHEREREEHEAPGDEADVSPSSRATTRGSFQVRRRTGRSSRSRSTSSRPTSAGTSERQMPRMRRKIDRSPLPSAFGVSRQEHRSAGGTSASTCSTCIPQPVYVGFLHLAHSIRRHMGSSFRAMGLLPMRARWGQKGSPAGTNGWRTVLEARRL